jgi:glycosyltransferase involved in cell wall biosynthesis
VNITRGKSIIYIFHTECIFLRGGEKYLFELLRRFSLSHRVVLCVQAISPYWSKKYKSIDVPVRVFWKPARFYWILLPVFLLINFLAYRKIISNNIIVATNFPVSLLAVLLSKKTIIHCFEPLPIFYDAVRIRSLPWFSRLCVRFSKSVYAWLDSYAIRKCSLLTTLSISVEAYIVSTYGRNCDGYLSNGIDSGLFAIKSFKRKNVNNYVIGHSTDYTVFKGTDRFLKALPLLVRQFPYLSVLITESMTDPGIKNSYRKFVAENDLSSHVTFMGTLDEKRLVSFYQKIDVYCYTGSPDCAGGSTASLSVLESESCGTPVVRSVGDFEEIIDGTTGYYCDPNDPEDISQKTGTLLHLSLPQKRRVGKACRKYVKQKFSWDKTSQTLGSLIKMLE